MITVNIHDAKTHLSHYVSLAEKGEKVILCKRNVPVAELCALSKNKPKRYIGKSKYDFDVPDGFFEPLPDDFISSFESHNNQDPL